MNRTILIIEDHADISENTAELLELSGYTVHTASDGKLGIEYTLKYKPHLILCDIMMPKMDGYHVLKTLINSPSTSKIPFVFFTAKSEEADVRKGIELGACGYIVKPFENDELLKVVAEKLQFIKSL